MFDSRCLMHSALLHCLGVKKKCSWLSWRCDECNWCRRYLRTCLDSSLPKPEFTGPRHKSAMPCWYKLLASITNCCKVPVNIPWSTENLSPWMLSSSPFLSFPRCFIYCVTVGWHFSTVLKETLVSGQGARQFIFSFWTHFKGYRQLSQVI